jgi:hypothetical protein
MSFNMVGLETAADFVMTNYLKEGIDRAIGFCYILWLPVAARNLLPGPKDFP